MTWQPYAYAGDNPTNSGDPSGLGCSNPISCFWDYITGQNSDNKSYTYVYDCGSFDVTKIVTGSKVKYQVYIPGLGSAQVSSGASSPGNRAVRVSQKGINIIIRHLSEDMPGDYPNGYDDVPYNKAQVARLQAALAKGETISGADAEFYLHEIVEATLMQRYGLSYEDAHALALARYQISPYNVYSPQVIADHPEDFGDQWFEFWGMQKGGLGPYEVTGPEDVP